MNKKNIEDLLRENLKREVPKELDKNFYQFTKGLKSEKESSRPLVWKSALAFSFVLALFVYNFQYKGQGIPNVSVVDIYESVDMLNEMEYLAEVENLSDEEFEFLIDDGDSDEV